MEIPAKLKQIIVKPEQCKRVNPLTSLASFPLNISVNGQNTDESILLFVREHKIILFGDLLLYTLILFLPSFIRILVTYLDSNFLSKSITNTNFFESKWWTVINITWFAYVFTGYFNIFFKWFYNINILTTERFMDIDFLGIFSNRIESASIVDIEDIKDSQKGLLQSIFNMGDLTLLTASGATEFSLANVPKAYKVRDFIQDVMIQVKEKRKANE